MKLDKKIGPAKTSYFDVKTPIENLDSESLRELKENVLNFVKSPKFREGPLEWIDEESYSMAYYAYCEGWGVEKDVLEALNTLLLGSIKGGPFLMRLLAEHYMFGFYGCEKDIRSALSFFHTSFRLTEDENERSYCAMSISRIYLEYFHTKFAEVYATPWMKVSLLYGDEDIETKEYLRKFLEDVEPCVKEYKAADLLRQYNKDPVKFKDEHEGYVMTATGRIGRVRLKRDSGIYYLELFPEPPKTQRHSTIQQTESIPCIMEDNDDLLYLTRDNAITVRGFCHVDEGEKKMMLHGCEVYEEPPIPLPPMPKKASPRRVIRNADFSPSKKKK